MKQYNHALDFTVLALASAANGNLEAAGKLLIKASKAHDVKRAVAILEASNAQAFAAQEKAKVEASKGKGKVGAASRVKAAAKTQVKAFDMGDEDDLQELTEDEEEVEASEHDEQEEEQEDEEHFDKSFASVLRGMTGKRK